MIKVIEVIPTLSMGGAESMLKDYCILMNKDRFDITVIVLTEHKHTPIEATLEEKGINVFYLGEMLYESNSLSFNQRIARKVSRYYFLRKKVLEINPDIIHLHLQIGKYMRALPLNKLKCKLFLTVHNVTWRYFSRDRKNHSRYMEYKEVYRLIHKYDLKLLALHDGLNNELKELFCIDSNRVITFHNGIQMDRFAPELYNKSVERYRLGIKENEIVIGHVGSMHPQKNHELILNVFNAYYRLNPLSKLILIGNGERKEKVIERIEQMGLTERVCVLSDRDDIPQLMRTMDVFLFPSRWEGFGNVLIEAQCMGLPCVVSDVVPKDTRITNNVHVVGLDDSIDNWINALDDALNGVEGMTKQVEPQEYDMRNVVKQLENLYSDSVFEKETER